MSDIHPSPRTDPLLLGGATIDGGQGLARMSLNVDVPPGWHDHIGAGYRKLSLLLSRRPTYTLALGRPNSNARKSAMCHTHRPAGPIDTLSVTREGFTMGLFDKIKKAFDAGGITTELHTPDAFRWQDETLPVSVRLTGHESEPRTVTSIEIRLRDADRDDTNRSAREREKDGIRFEYRETVVLQPGESATIDIDFPLTTSGIIEQVGAIGHVPGWLATAAKVVDTAQNLSTDSSHYVISATPKIEGAKIDRGVTRRIRQVGRGDFFVGGG